jgi:hypothetical protein
VPGEETTVRRILGELHNWRDYTPAVLWALAALAVTVAGPVWAILS